MKENPVLTNSRKEFTQPIKKFNKILHNLGAPHVDSFDYMLTEGLQNCVDNMNPMEFELASGDRITLKFSSISINNPRAPESFIHSNERAVYPTECRQRKITYSGACIGNISIILNGLPLQSVTVELGDIPIMLRTQACNLHNLSSKELVARKEHEREWGGYFVVKGHERLIRMLILTRRNYPVALQRATWKNRGKSYTDLGIMIRCVSSNQTSINNVLHFLSNGRIKFMISHLKRLSFIPVLLLMKAIINYTDEKLCQELSKGMEDDLYYLGCVQSMLREVHDEGIHSHFDAKCYLGKIFRSRFHELPHWKTDSEITDYLIKQCVLIHLDDALDKFNLIVYMVKKLFMLAAGNKIMVENVDSVMMMELLLGGHLYQQVIKERLDRYLFSLKVNILKSADKDMTFDQSTVLNAAKRSGHFTSAMDNFLATGNLVSSSGLGLMQSTGLTIVAENINRMRYMAHFRSIHRGSFFLEMRTTEARQLLPDAWGFICPVHTPDGTPCGLLNHLTVDCVVSGQPDAEIVDKMPHHLVDLGMTPINTEIVGNYKDYETVMLEGRIIGHVQEANIVNFAQNLRVLKIEGQKVPQMMEIVLIPRKIKGQRSGLFLCVGAARMMRPVINLKLNHTEYIGTFEQIYMDICINLKEAYQGITTHMEISKTAFLSNLAKLIPMPDCNQSPRNMYQCQMGKQTMGSPVHNWQYQQGSKMYRIQTPGAPLFRPVHHDNMELDDFAMGTNAIVAVISYTGYDMEDAMVINKAAEERGFSHGTVYNSMHIVLPTAESYFVRDPNNKMLIDFLDNDGFPQPGMRLTTDSYIYCFYNSEQSQYSAIKWTGKEDAVIAAVRLCGTFAANQPKSVIILYRLERNPSVGDKFASRAGQKGICSQKWPAEDLPFTESGMIPDIIFNPHGFPSRMTIAMMIEIMAGKSASLHGLVHDATPFKFTEKDTAIDYFGKLLEEGGYNYYGTERMYSGIDGREMKAEIFFGVVHYQRLRHMVSDKWQVRSTGPVDSITHQPVKGRKRGGGVRFGEMERDALIAHGTSFLLQDRLFHCSDKTSVLICTKCGTLIGPIDSIVKRGTDSVLSTDPSTCRLCANDTEINLIEIPYIFKFLVTQLSAFNITVKMEFTST